MMPVKGAWLVFFGLTFSFNYCSGQFHLGARRVDFEGPDQDQNQVENIQYVLGVLKERGLLKQVDPSLLNKAKNLIQSTSQNEEFIFDSSPFSSPPPVPVLAPAPIQRKQAPRTKSDLYKASRERILNGFYHNSAVTVTERPSLAQKRTADPRKSDDRLRPNEVEICQALKTENQLLKQLLNKEYKKQGKSAPRILDTLANTNNNAVSPLNIFADQYLNHLEGSESNQSPVFTPSNPLEALLNKEEIIHAGHPLNLIPGRGKDSSSRPRSNRNINVNIETKSVLITPTPVLSTQYETSSLTTTVTTNITKELELKFHGRKLITQIVETSVQVKTTATTFSNIVTITPTPSWSYITVTHTASRNGIGNYAGDPKLQKIPFGGIRADVVEIPESLDSFKSLTDVLRVIKAKLGVPVPSLVPVSSKTTEFKPVGPSTSVMTIFLSGSKPGEFTTSLRTITLEAADRQKRSALEAAEVGWRSGLKAADVGWRSGLEAVAPSPVQYILQTQLAELEDFLLSHTEQNLELESSMVSSIPGHGGHYLVPGDHRYRTENLVSTKYVTVTVHECAI